MNANFFNFRFLCYNTLNDIPKLDYALLLHQNVSILEFFKEDTSNTCLNYLGVQIITRNRFSMNANFFNFRFLCYNTKNYIPKLDDALLLHQNVSILEFFKENTSNTCLNYLGVQIITSVSYTHLTLPTSDLV